ncbi:hypothetical protein PHYSODRAFT_332563 [Phytophthora sojae]|uniref:Uncharacterized protein n=1 Tax=Phytophthora sojae (strain P6497) TaxID=1094619 RepID=G4ZJG0_PHYSP|nr:hypothetical protein PHYSODRAFT_332563 [Phytophthora sojae]EGZ18825.1 hypothetical protein PHYSODRAFT_332563 [Phytophthora sojae]|eukprot:XP_009527883.1 hypothetical protein PHYSODRAFT_332563 [Phytophthora sojae]
MRQISAMPLSPTPSSTAGGSSIPLQSPSSSLTLTLLAPSAVATAATLEEPIQLAQDTEQVQQSRSGEGDLESSAAESDEPDNSAVEDWSEEEMSAEEDDEDE